MTDIHERIDGLGQVLGDIDPEADPKQANEITAGLEGLLAHLAAIRYRTLQDYMDRNAILLGQSAETPSTT